MFDTRSVYALNKLDRDAIVYPSVTGEDIRLTREDFSSEEEFLYWKKKSDADYRKTENDGQNDSRCLSLDTQRDTPAPSAEDVVLEHIVTAENAAERAAQLTKIKGLLTTEQYRRLRLFHIQKLSVEKIATMESVSIKAIYKSLRKAHRVIVKKL